MTSDVMNAAIRWVFWGILYLTTVLVAVLLFLGSFAPYVPGPLRWAMLGVVVFGIVLDAQTKARGSDTTSKPGPPSGGDLEPSTVRNR
ncbi:hypothetical protein [Phycicoccus flavus]|uniref:hypothetical protein n=1 Tax=Phycicoccus flavus TaxID=2502783 RepID=UPI000FEBC426|nr:hypothetical protein [Phycicoccus flavus]NHA67587.1 hypothetical protein [Phycicoccus flavus]